MATPFSYVPPKPQAWAGLGPSVSTAMPQGAVPNYQSMLTSYFGWDPNNQGQVAKNNTDPPGILVGGTPGTSVSGVGPGSGGGTPPSGGAGGAASPWANDPILLRQEALDAKMVADAQAGALAQRKSSLINYGDPTLAQKVLGDQNTTLSAKNNQFSTLAQLLNQYTLGQGHMNEDLSDHNLFFSSTRVNDLTQTGKAYEGQKYQASGAVQQALSNIANALLQAKYQAQQNDINAEQAAYERYLQSLLQNQAAGGGSPGGSPPPGGDPSGGFKPTPNGDDQYTGMYAAIVGQRNYIPNVNNGQGYLIHGV